MTSEAATQREAREQGPAGDPPVVPHSPLEDVLGVLIGTYVVSFGVAVLGGAGAVTGGTAGLSLLVAYVLDVPFGPVFALVNLPFFVLAWFRKGTSFTVRSAVSVALVSGFATLHDHLLTLPDLAPLYAVLTADLLIGIGLLIVFRHGSSLGGFNVVALLAQERFGWRAGYVQMGMDVVVVLAAFAVAAPLIVLVSALGALVLNQVLALNHRPGRYLGA
ncbi:YitT family protein [Nocardioides acrostichi]|uniref:YitT family protein n=1 Tax=Nocardioides acrostichi TaxID=2784339 RepID=UPI002E2DB2A6|nr:YitT family protein [Nocardioides acrostichi]